MQPIGIVANPASGKDIRRLAAKASVFDNREKEAIIRRAVTGAVAAGGTEYVYMHDSHGIARSAFEDVPAGNTVTEVICPRSATALDTIEAAGRMRDAGCCVVLVLGGDGTSRAFTRGWRDAALLPLSTGTNNVFPVFAEATVAGSVLGLLAAGKLGDAEVMEPVKIIDIEIEGETPDLALIDAVLTDDEFVGARALLDAGALRAALMTRAEPAAVGVTSLGGLLRPIGNADDAGLYLEFGDGGIEYSAPLAPGLYCDIRVSDMRDVSFDESIELTGPGVLALDGERERVINPGQRVTMRVSRTGPRVLNIETGMQLAACRGLFRR